jgi:hypothetical protein
MLHQAEDCEERGDQGQDGQGLKRAGQGRWLGLYWLGGWVVWPVAGPLFQVDGQEAEHDYCGCGAHNEYPV